MVKIKTNSRTGPFILLFTNPCEKAHHIYKLCKFCSKSVNGRTSMQLHLKKWHNIEMKLSDWFDDIPNIENIKDHTKLKHVPKILRRNKNEMIIMRPKIKCNRYTKPKERQKMAMSQINKVNSIIKSQSEIEDGYFERAISKFMGKPKKNVATLAIYKRMAPWELCQS